MKKLPNGYFAVKNDLENSDKTVFEYRGETFSAVEGENLFGNIKDAVEAANGAAAPSEVIANLPYEKFEAPVVLFSSGEHEVNSFDRIKVYNSLIMLGEKAGVNPNLPAPDRKSEPALNPEREKNESVLVGSYWYGKIFIEADKCELFIMDGFTSAGVRFKDTRSNGGKFRFESKNIIHKGKCGWEHNQYSFQPLKPDSALDRDVLIQNVRMIEFPDLDYGGSFALLNARKAVLDNICMTKSGQLFGMTSLTRSVCNCSQFDKTEIILKNSFIADLTGEQGITLGCYGSNSAVDFKIDNCTLIDAVRENQPFIKTHIANEASTASITNSVLIDTRGNRGAAVESLGDYDNTVLKNCEIVGFASDKAIAPITPKEAPDFIKAEPGETGLEDSHEIIENADFSAIEEHYKDRKAYYGDQHVHTKCGGTSDGSFPMADWPQEMDRLGLDFAIIVDHRQMRGFFLPEWDNSRFLMGNEPSAQIKELNAVNFGYDHIHYNMLVPHKYGLAMIYANFPEFNFRGDELTGSHGYPAFTKERFMELTKFIQSIGGMLVHPHPKTMLSSNDPLDFYFGEHMYLETLYEKFESHFCFKNCELWEQLLKLGKHVYASGGSDTHRKPTNALVSTFYTKERSDEAFFEQMRSGDYTVGCVGFKMMIDGCPMGSELEYNDSMVLTLEAGDFFKYQIKEDTAYELRIYTEKGLVYKGLYNGKQTQRVALKCKKRAYYRAEVFDITHGYRVAVGNPIWLDKEKEN